MTVTQENFPQLVISSFPSLKEEIEDDDDLLHLQMATLLRFCQSAVESGDLETGRKCVQLVDNVFADCDDKVKNAVYVSFLENVVSEGPVFQVLTPRLKVGWTEIMDYLDELDKNIKNSKNRS